MTTQHSAHLAFALAIRASTIRASALRALLVGAAVSLAVCVLAWGAVPAAPSVAAPHSQTARCKVTTDKVARPTVVSVGQAVEVSLHLRADCPPGASPVTASDIVLVIDRSASMRDNELFVPTINAARVFLSLTDFSIHQVALVTFHTPLIFPEVNVNQPLSSDAEAVRAALERIPEPAVITGPTDLTSAIRGAQAELASPRARPTAQPVLVLLTDGEHNAPFTQDPTVAANEAKAAGTLVLTIGLGVSDAARQSLEAIATRPDLYFDAPSADELRDVYRAIAGQLSAPGVLADIEIVDILSTEVELVEGSVVPEPTEQTRSSMTWRMARLPSDGWSATYLVRPLVAGTYPTNKLAYSDYIDADGSIGSSPFPRPIIDVSEADDRFRAWLPALYKDWCKPARPFDVVLALDASNSMDGAKLSDSLMAMREFISFLDMPPARAGVVTFNEAATPLVDLNADRPAVLSALDDVRTGPGTRIDRALRASLAMLQARPDGMDGDRLAVIILLTDGRHNGSDEQDVWNAAAALRRSGLDLAVYTIGVGEDVDAGLLRQIVAPHEDRYYPAASSAQLVQIYRAIAGTLPCGR